jgi:hypothetical protein
MNNEKPTVNYKKKYLKYKTKYLLESKKTSQPILKGGQSKYKQTFSN